MKASKLIEELQTYIDRYGDLPVYMDNKDTEFLHEVEDVGLAIENILFAPANEPDKAILLSPQKIET